MDSGFWKLDCCNKSRLMHSLHFIHYFPSVCAVKHLGSTVLCVKKNELSWVESCWSSLHHRRKIHFSLPRHYYAYYRPAFYLITAATGALALLNRLFERSPGQTQNLTAFFFYARWEWNELQNASTIKSSPFFEHLLRSFKNSPGGNLLLFYLTAFLFTLKVEHFE